MRRILVTCLPVLMCAPAAHAAVLSLRAVGGADDATLALGVSETAAIEIVLELDEFEEAAGAHVFLDTVMTDPPGAEDEEAFVVIGVLREGDPDFVWTGVREFSPDPIREIEFEDLPPPEGFSIDGMGYFLVAMMAAEDSLPGGAGVSYILDRIIIHGMTPGTVELTFESGLRPPEVFGPGWSALPLTLGLGDFGVETGPPSQQRERRPITITVGDSAVPDDEGDGTPGGDAGGGDAGGASTDEGAGADDGSTDPGGDQSGDAVVDEPGQGPDEGGGQTGTDGGDTASPDDGDASSDQADTGGDGSGDMDEQPGGEGADVAETPDEPGPSSPDDVADGGDAGGAAGETPSTDAGNQEDSSGARPLSGPCGFGAIPAVLAILLGLLAMQPHSRRRP
jgi:hypothetical protein